MEDYQKQKESCFLRRTCWQDDVFPRMILQSFFLKVVKDMAKVCPYSAGSIQYNQTLEIASKVVRNMAKITHRTQIYEEQQISFRILNIQNLKT